MIPWQSNIQIKTVIAVLGIQRSFVNVKTKQIISRIIMARSAYSDDWVKPWKLMRKLENCIEL